MNVTRRGRSVQCCTCSKWVHLQCSPLSFLDSVLLAALTPGSALPVASLLLLEISYLPTLWLLPRTPPACIPPLLNLAHLAHSSNAALPPHPRLQTSLSPLRPLCIFSLCTLTPLHASSCFSAPRASSFPLTSSGFFNGMLRVSEPGALSFYTLFRLIPLTSSVSRNSILTHLPLFGSLDSPLCVLIAPTPSLVFFLLIPHMLGVA